MKNKLIIGSSGQDGILLANLFEIEDTKIFTINKIGMYYQGQLLTPYEMITSYNLSLIILEHEVEEIYFVAGDSKSSIQRLMGSLDENIFNSGSDIFLIIKLLDAITLIKSTIKFFFTSSSLIFAGTSVFPQKEDHRTYALEKYAKNKLMISNLLREYEIKNQRKFKLYIGIMYNHESIYRKKDFFTRIVIEHALDCYKNKKKYETMKVKYPQDIIDMSYAKDFMINAINLLSIGEPGDYIFSSGTGIKAIDFVKEVFNYLNLDYAKHIDADLVTCKERISPILIGNNSKLKKALGDRYAFSSNKLSYRLTRDWLNHYGYD